jgi:hypothetical protein
MGALAPLRVVGPPPTAPPYGLVTTPGTIVPQDDPHYLGGVVVDSYPDNVPSTHNPCAAGTSRVKDVGSDPPAPEFSSFTVYLPVDCSGIGVGDRAGADLLRNRAIETFQATESYGAERELMFADVDAADRPHLSELTVAQYLNGGAATGPREALSLLESAIGLTGRNGFIHVDPGTFDAMASYPLFVAAGGVMRTLRGNTVIIGNGYIGSQPDAQGADADPLNDDQNWAFATGPVRVSRDDIFVPTLEEVFDATTNALTFRVERNYVAYWDTALLRGVLVDRSTTP